MKVKQIPDVEVMIEVSSDEFRELIGKGGLMLQADTKSGESVHFWRIHGTWILILVKDTIDVPNREVDKA